MSVLSQTPPDSPAGASPERRVGGRRIGLRDLGWLAWRQHRWLALVAVLVAGHAGFLVWVASRLPRQPCAVEVCFFIGSPYFTPATNLMWATLLLPAFVAVFVGAPLLAREYEQRTHLVAWSQDVSSGRWLLTRVGFLAVVAAGLAAGTALAAQAVVNAFLRNEMNEDGFSRPWDPLMFEAAVPAAVGYVLFGLALGVLAGALFRRVVPAMGVALVAFAAVRFGLQRVRLRLLPPNTAFTPADQVVAGAGVRGPYPDLGDPSASVLDEGFVNAGGGRVHRQLADMCWTGADLSDEQVLSCVRSTAISGYRIRYQPLDRLADIRLVETGIYLGLAAVCILLAWYLVRRRRTLS